MKPSLYVPIILILVVAAICAAFSTGVISL